jgi:hypothetical protein
MSTKRLAGDGFLIAAAIALVYDIGRVLFGASGFTPAGLGTLWYGLHPSSLNGAQAGIQRFVSPLLWDPVISTLLQMPLFLVCGAIGLLLLGLSLPKRSIDKSA